MSVVLDLDYDGDFDTVRDGLTLDMRRLMTGLNRLGANILNNDGTITETLVRQITGASALTYPMGGSDQARVPTPVAGTYYDVWNSNPYYAQSSFTGTMRVWGWSLPGTTPVITLALFNYNTGVRQASPPIVATTRFGANPVGITFDVGIEAGMTYRLQIASNTIAANGQVYGIGQLEANPV